MITKAIALLTKYLMEEKEFFLYPRKSIQQATDITLHKPIWFRESFLSFIDGNDFFAHAIEYQKSVIYNPILEIKMGNSLKKLFFYRVILADGHENEMLQSLDLLKNSLQQEKINLTLLLVNLQTQETTTLFSNFDDQEDIEKFIRCGYSKVVQEELEHINLLEVEHTVKQSKGYYPQPKKFYITTVLIAINILVFLYMSLTGNTTDTSQLIAFGAKYNPMVADGDYYRLFTSMFIHIGLLHLVLNSYALHMLGKDVESIYGTPKFLWIYLVSGVFGGLGSFLFSPAVSAGASGAIFGLMGSFLYFGIRKPTIFSTRYGLNLITLLCMNIVLGLTSPSIDNFAHLGGLFGGLMASWAIGLRKEKIYFLKRLLSQGLMIILIVALLTTGVTIQRNSWQYHLYKGAKYLEDGNVSDAQEQFENGIQQNSDIPEFYFYLAYVYYLKGDIPSSIRYAEQSLSIEPSYTAAKKFLDELKRIQQNPSKIQ